MRPSGSGMWIPGSASVYWKVMAGPSMMSISRWVVVTGSRVGLILQSECGIWKPGCAHGCYQATQIGSRVWPPVPMAAWLSLAQGILRFVYGTWSRGAVCAFSKATRLRFEALRLALIGVTPFRARVTERCVCGSWTRADACGFFLMQTGHRSGPPRGAVIGSTLFLATTIGSSTGGT